jgi:DtxR family Mn-dependent transcriptional regulator
MELTEGLEDYLEAILLCDKKRGYVRTKHLAQRLKVKSPSVNAAVKELTRRHLVVHEAYGPIKLTSKGRNVAESVYNRHKVLYRFFCHTLGLSAEDSNIIACGIEHHIDESGIDRLKRLLDFLSKKSKENETFKQELNNVLFNEVDRPTK